MRQWNRLGARVQLGAKASFIIAPIKVSESAKRRQTDKLIGFRPLAVFNVEQVNGYSLEQMDLFTSPTEIRSVDDYVARSGARVLEGSDGAYYTRSQDRIYMPSRSSFHGTRSRTATEAFYAVLLHEVVHWTGHEIRCARDLSGCFGDSNYAFEELVAELGAAMLCCHLGVTNTPRADHAQYIASWSGILAEDPGTIVRAATLAGKAIGYVDEKTGAGKD